MRTVVAPGLAWTRVLVTRAGATSGRDAFGASLAFSAVWAFWQQPRLWPRLVAVLLAYGIGIEIAQSFIPSRDADWHDVVADSVGIALGLLAAWPVSVLAARDS